MHGGGEHGDERWSGAADVGDDRGHAFDARQLGGRVAAVPVDELVVVVLLGDDDGLLHAVRAQGCCELGEVAQVVTDVARVGPDLAGRDDLEGGAHAATDSESRTLATCRPSQ